MNSYLSCPAKLQCLWFYEKAVTDCLCVIITAGRTPMNVGEELYCEAHERVAKVTAVEPATLAQQDELLEVNA